MFYSLSEIMNNCCKKFSDRLRAVHFTVNGSVCCKLYIWSDSITAPTAFIALPVAFLTFCVLFEVIAFVAAKAIPPATIAVAAHIILLEVFLLIFPLSFHIRHFRLVNIMCREQRIIA